jgi:Bardet-Biedl syndrome 7 protein
VVHVLHLLDFKFKQQYNLAQEVQLIEALKELQMQENEIDFLSEEYSDILKRSEIITAQFKNQPRKLSYLYAIIIDL